MVTPDRKNYFLELFSSTVKVLPLLKIKKKERERLESKTAYTKLLNVCLHGQNLDQREGLNM